jgi:hypothetical protein
MKGANNTKFFFKKSCFRAALLSWKHVVILKMGNKYE